MPTFHFAIVVHGECCTRGHLWVQSHTARTVKAATAKMLRAVRRAKYTPVEYAQLPSPQVVGTIESTSDVVWE